MHANGFAPDEPASRLEAEELVLRDVLVLQGEATHLECVLQRSALGGQVEEFAERGEVVAVRWLLMFFFSKPMVELRGLVAFRCQKPANAESPCGGRDRRSVDVADFLAHVEGPPRTTGRQGKA
jgi:hypothetical protein